MTIRQLAQYLGVPTVQVCIALVCLEHPPEGLDGLDDEIPTGGYELAAAQKIIARQDETIDRILGRPRPRLTK